MATDNDDSVTALLEAHEAVCREIESAEERMMDGEEWVEGHKNGLKEARNRIEQLILERAGAGDIDD